MTPAVPHYDAVVIGGGLAGSSAALQLARAGRHVLLLEKQRYPAHKLCGEFLSTEVARIFERLGVLEAVRSAGAHPIRHARLTAPGGASFETPLPGTALGLSRYALDPLLFAAARAAGAEACDGTAARAVTGSLEEGFEVVTARGSVRARVVLGAYGKRGVLDRTLERPFMQETTPFVGFKAHYEGLSLPGLIELHAFPGGYCGLSHVEGGRVNACWITHERALRAAGGRPEAMVDQALGQNPALAERFSTMRRTFDGFLAVSQVTFARKGTFSGDVCMVGDTAAMIAPLCGDGMAMALHAADLAAPLANDYLEGRLGADAFRARYGAAWDEAFRRRLRLGRLLHHVSLWPLTATLAVQLCRLWPGLGRWLVRQTRGE